MARNYNELKNIINKNQNKLAYFKCMQCILFFQEEKYPYKGDIIKFCLDNKTKLPNHAQVFVLYGSDFYGIIETIELKRENTTATTFFDSCYSSVLDTKLLINDKLYYHWQVMTNGHYDQQIYWEIIQNHGTKL